MRINRDRQALDAACRTDFPTFLHRCFQTVSPGDVYQDNWHLEAMAHQLDRVRAGETRRLIITVPPRSLKSIACSVAWEAWMLGHDPSVNFLCVSYGAELAAKHARDCRIIMQSEWYRRLFPGTILSRERNAEHDFQTTARGGRFSTSVGGTLTGRGGDIIIIDDPMKPEEAMSETARKYATDWAANTLASRLNDKVEGAIVLVMQRLHDADLAGHYLEAGGWDHLSLPAIADEDEAIPLGAGRFHHRRKGDVLHPAREPLAALEAQKLTMGSAAFSAQYQQAPIPPGGVLVQRSWLRRYQSPLERARGDTIVQSWDCASKDGIFNDYSVCVTALLRKQETYILHVSRERLEFPALCKRAVALARAFDIDALLIEDAASGTQLIQHLKAEQPGGVPLPIRRKPEGDKVARLAGVTARIEAGGVFLPVEADWLAEFERELLGFPNARHDDQVDAFSQLLNWVDKQRANHACVDTVPVGPMVFARGRWITDDVPWEGGWSDY
jgi:predicted phage terminase large subunit-like protein